MTFAAADYRVKEAPSGSMTDQALEDQERAAREWIEGHLGEVDAAMSQGNPEAAFGIVTTLYKVAIDRKLTKLDAELVQPVLARVIQALIQKSTSTDRAELQGLLGFLDAQHDAEARSVAGAKFSAQANAQRELVKAAEAKGHKLALYLHRALVDYYAMTRIEDKERLDRESDIRAATSIQYTVMESPDCHGTTGTTNDFNRSHLNGSRAAMFRVRISRCSVDLISDEVTREIKKYGRFVAGRSSTTTTDGYYERRNIVDSSGNTIRTESTGNYVEGTSSTTTTPDSYVTEDIAVDVHRSKRQYTMEGTIVIDGDVPSGSVPISVSTTTEGERWEPAQALPEGRWQESSTPSSGPSGPEVLQAGMAAALSAAKTATERALGQQFLEAARGASREDSIDKYAAALFLDIDGDAAAALEQLLGVPAAALRAAVRPAPAFEAKSELAFKLGEPEALSESDRASIEQGFDEIERKAGGAQIELAAGLQTSVPTRIDMGDSATAPDPSSSYGAVVGLRIMGGVDPGRTETAGLLGGGGGELRLGYAGGAFFDVQLPLYLGFRVSGLGIAAKAFAGWNKLGKEEAADLWVRNAPYVGYGLDVSYVTYGLTDFAASYAHHFRSQDWQEPENYSVVPGTKGQITGDEYRYELRITRWGDESGDARVLTGRYSRFTGDSKDGYAFTLSLGIMADAN